MPLMKKLLKDITTENDNDTFCAGRLLWIIGTLVFLGLTIYTVVVKGAVFTMQDYGIGLGGLLVGGGGGVKLNGGRE